MLTVLNVGNSLVHMGGYEKGKQIFCASVATEPGQTGDYYACVLQQVFRLRGVDAGDMRGAVISSVVPAMKTVMENALGLLGVTDIIEVSSGVRTGLDIRSEHPRQIGSDRVACAVAARAKGKLPCIAVSLCTATTFTVLDASGALVGSAITAGVQLSLKALRAAAAQLPAVAIELGGGDVLARNTSDSMRVGAVYGAAAMVDGMAARFAGKLGTQPYIVITGDDAPLVEPYLSVPHEYDANLLLDGLYLIWKRNRR